MTSQNEEMTQPIISAPNRSPKAARLLPYASKIVERKSGQLKEFNMVPFDNEMQE